MYYQRNPKIHPSALYKEVVSAESAISCRYGKSFTPKAFQNLRFRTNKHTVFIVQEDYTRWAEHAKSKKSGKRAAIFQSPLRIIRELSFDDIDCWNICNGSLARFVHVNSVKAVIDDDYFTCAVTEKQLKIWETFGFWSIWLLLIAIMWCASRFLGWTVHPHCVVCQFHVLFDCKLINHNKS